MIKCAIAFSKRRAVVKLSFLSSVITYARAFTPILKFQEILFA